MTGNPTGKLARFVHSQGWMTPLPAERATSAVIDTIAAPVRGGQRRHE